MDFGVLSVVGGLRILLGCVCGMDLFCGCVDQLV